MDMSSQAENEQSLQIWSLRATKDDSELTYYKKMQTQWTHCRDWYIYGFETKHL